MVYSTRHSVIPFCFGFIQLLSFVQLISTISTCNQFDISSTPAEAEVNKEFTLDCRYTAKDDGKNITKFGWFTGIQELPSTSLIDNNYGSVSLTSYVNQKVSKC